jgi:hypothetical protein
VSKPDLAINCKLCGVYLNLDELKDHEQHHHALSLFGFKDFLALKLHDLNSKRKELLVQALHRYLKKSSSATDSAKSNEWRLRVSQINNAYELLKSHLSNTFEVNRQIKTHLKFNSKGKRQQKTQSSGKFDFKMFLNVNRRITARCQ